MSERIAIFGEKGRWGSVLAERSRKLGHEIRGIDPRAEIQEDPREAIRWATVLAFAVFPHVLNEIIEELEEEITEDKIVFDIAGKKNSIIPNLRKLDAKGVSVCSTHPLVNEKQPLKGQKILIMAVGQSSQKALDFSTDFFSSLGMIPINLDLNRHDEDMDPEQGLPHTNLRSIEFAVAREKLDPITLWEMAPANAELFWLSNWRTWNQPPEISAQAIDSFLRTDRGKRMTKNQQEFTTKMQEIVENNDSETSQQLLTQLFQEEFASLKNHPVSQEIQEKTTIILERLANLRLHSITIFSPEDRPGVLHEITGIFARNAINLTAVDSHEPNGGGITFMFGEEGDREQVTQALVQLEENGFKVLEVVN